MKIKRTIWAFLPIMFIAIAAHAQGLPEALKYSESERYDLADAVFKKLLVADGANGDVYYYYAKNFIATEDLDSAEVVLRKGVEKVPAGALNYVGLAAVSMHRGKKAEAQTNIDKALSLDNKTITVFVEGAYALINAELKDTAQAMRLLEKAREIDLGKDKKPKTAALYIALGDVFLEANKGGDAMNNYEKALTLDKNSVNANLRIGQLWVRARNFSSALDAYNKAIKQDSTFAPAYREKGNFYFLFDKYGLALEEYKKYLSLSKNNFKARVRYAKFLFLAKQYNDAISEIDGIFKIDSSLVVLKRLKAYSLYETRKYPEGLKAINRFFAQQPPDKLLSSDYEYLGKLLVKTGQDSLGVNQLIEIYNRDTTRKDLSGEIGSAYLNMKKYNEAIKFLKIKTSMPKGVLTADWLYLGSAYYQSKKWLSADSAFANATTLQPDYAKGYLLRARSWAKVDTGETKKYLALPYYELFVKKIKANEIETNKPALSEAYKYIGYYYFVQKNLPYSLFCFNAALENKPDDKDVTEFLKKKEFEGVSPQCMDCFVVITSAPDFTITYQFENGTTQNMDCKGQTSRSVLMPGQAGSSYNVAAKAKAEGTSVEIKVYKEGKVINEAKSVAPSSTTALSGNLP